MFLFVCKLYSFQLKAVFLYVDQHTIFFHYVVSYNQANLLALILEFGSSY